MKTQRNRTRHPNGLILTLAILVTAGTLLLCQASLTSAQTPAPSWSYTGNLNTARYGHTATLLPSGKVLVAGGGPVEAELYDPASRTWSVTGSLNKARHAHTATLLPNGKVLVAGGGLVEAELYDPATGTWSVTGNLNVPRSLHTATLLPNSEVLVTGGETGSYFADNTAEKYDPVTGKWSTTDNLKVGRLSHTATLLQNGKVLVAGGCAEVECWPGPFSTELYDPKTGTWSVTGSLDANRNIHTAMLLPNGKVLVAGGGGFPCSGGYCYSTVNSSAELYDPATETWSYTGSLSRRAGHTATLLPNGQFLAAGGADYGVDIGHVTILKSADIYDPATGKWNSTASLNAPRFGHTATLLPNGKVLVAGGYDGSTNRTNRTAELYDSGIISTPNAIDDAPFFVTQHYRDFLSREPDGPGLSHWAGEITACSDSSQRQLSESIDQCLERKRANTSAAFFLSPEFQNTGSFVLRVYWGTLGKLPNAQCAGLPAGSSGQCRPLYGNYVADMTQVAKGIVVNDQLAPEVINANKRAFVDQFITRSEFKTVYDSLSNQQFVDKLFATTGIAAAGDERSTLVNGLNSGTETRSSVVFKVVDGTQTITGGALIFNTRYGQEFYDREFDAAFVFMEYAGYLHRNPDQAGYDHWLGKLKLYVNWQDAQMVMAFILSPEYRQRFGQ